jgi:hypothetical protein
VPVENPIAAPDDPAQIIRVLHDVSKLGDVSVKPGVAKRCFGVVNMSFGKPSDGGGVGFQCGKCDVIGHKTRVKPQSVVDDKCHTSPGYGRLQMFE